MERMTRDKMQEQRLEPNLKHLSDRSFRRAKTEGKKTPSKVKENFPEGHSMCPEHSDINM